MLINLTDVLTSDDKCRLETVILSGESFRCGSEEYSFAGTPQVTLTFTNIGLNKALIEGKAEIILKMPCSRCLQPVEESIQLEFAHEVTAPDGSADISEEDEPGFMEGYQLNVEDLLRSEIIINLPTKVLCKENCKGICTQCGQNLNEKKCGCDTFVPDPRMAAIKDIFNANKEVE